MPDLPPKFKTWESPKVASTKEVIKQYEKGFAGALYSPEKTEEFLDGCTYKSGEDVCRDFGYEETAANELVLPVLEVTKAYPGCLPGGGQVEGDCVSWGQRNANLLTMVLEAVLGLPDQVSGKVEGLPEVSALAQKNGVLSTEAIYYYRSTKPGHGWFCAEAAKVSQTKAGCVLRQDYGNVNLTQYSGSTVNYFNRKSVPNQLTDKFDDHIVREATVVNSMEAMRDLLARGFGIQSCGSESFSHTRDENGVCSRTRQGWAHSMGILACDDRPTTITIYGGRLYLVQNSWNEYMTGPRTIRGTQWEIPPGSFWARERDIKNRQFIAMAGVNGWARKKLPDYNPGW